MWGSFGTIALGQSVLARLRHYCASNVEILTMEFSKTWIWSFIFMALGYVAGMVVEHQQAILDQLLSLSPDRWDALVAAVFPIVMGWIAAWKQTLNRNDGVKTETLASPVTGVKLPATQVPASKQW